VKNGNTMHYHGGECNERVRADARNWNDLHAFQ
jgi:hypothetical protein